MAQTAFVTGGTGFVGINLIELLVEEGWAVTALHRSTSDTTYMKRFPIALVEGSVTDHASLRTAVPDGTDVVFHVAGDTSFWSKQNARQDAINIDGTQNMVDVAADKGVKTFIHTSSVSAWGRVRGVVTEDTPSPGEQSSVNYERSKYLGELEALQGVDRGMKVVVINPGGVAGPYDTKTFGKIFFLLRDGALPAALPGTITIAHVHDVVRAHLAAVERGRSGERYIMANDPVEWVDLVGTIAEVSGISKVPRRAPPLLLKLMGRLSVIVAAVTGKEPDITPEVAEITSTRGVDFRSDKAIRELGYATQPMAVAMKDNYDWLVREGLL
ncbi:MAG: NAD-dependent epimerase/dehydratase family protein [Deltaproteobacteria bacterium]|nr:NAD-dependent epimerase/dehydratase family protein [Deltaproteobacteria bacterium]